MIKLFPLNKVSHQVGLSLCAVGIFLGYYETVGIGESRFPTCLLAEGEGFAGPDRWIKIIRFGSGPCWASWSDDVSSSSSLLRPNGPCGSSGPIPL